MLKPNRGSSCSFEESSPNFFFINYTFNNSSIILFHKLRLHKLIQERDSRPLPGFLMILLSKLIILQNNTIERTSFQVCCHPDFWQQELIKNTFTSFIRVLCRHILSVYSKPVLNLLYERGKEMKEIKNQHGSEGVRARCFQVILSAVIH